MKINSLKFLAPFIFLILVMHQFSYGEDNFITFSKIYTGSGDDWFTSIIQTPDGGYIAVGTKETKSKAKSDLWILKIGIQGETQWEKTFYNSDWNKANKIRPTRDNGYIIIGEGIIKTQSGRIVQVIKLNEKGNFLWSKTFNFSDDNEANDIIETEEGGFLITGALYYREKKNSYLWILKLDSLGEIIWNNTYGGSSWDTGNSITASYGHCYVIGGACEDEGTGYKNIWIIKIDNSGEMIWDRVYKQFYWNSVNSIHQTANSNFIAVGYTYGKDTKKSSVWALFLDKEGDKVWDKVYGGEDWDSANSLQPTLDNNFIIAGYTKSKGAGKKDAWIIKFDSAGEIIWDRTYGSGADDEALSIVSAGDGGYIIAGYSTSIEEDVKNGWLLKLNKDGSLPPAPVKEALTVTFSPVSNRIYSSENEGCILSSVQTKDDGYILAGYSVLSNKKTKNGYLIKLNKDGKKQWDNIYKSDKHSQINSILQTKDGHYIAAGCTISKGRGESDIWIFKADKTGKPLWTKNIGLNNENKAVSICETADGNYLAAGFTIYPKDKKGQEIWLIKLNPKGTVLWDKTIGGKGNDEPVMILPTSDKGFIITENTSSKTKDKIEIGLLKVNALGEKVWEKTYGENNINTVRSMQITARKGYILTGSAIMKNHKTAMAVMRISKNGNMIWSKTFERGSCSIGRSIIQTGDEEFLAGGETVLGGEEGLDIWFMKLDSHGNTIWNKTYGGKGIDNTCNIFITKDNKYLLTGSKPSRENKKNNFFTLKFEEKKGVNKLRVITEPAEANIYLNDEFMGISPVEISGKTAEYNKLLIQKENHYDINEDVLINNKSIDRLFFTLPMRAGILKIFSYFSGIKFFIDNKEKRVIDQGKVMDIPILQGEYQLKFKNELSIEKTIPIKITENQTNMIILDDRFFSSESW